MASVMACLSPREINIDIKRFTSRTWVHDLASQVHTGDIILFSSKHSASYITKFFTQSGVPASRRFSTALRYLTWWCRVLGAGFDHIGMVVKPSPTQVFLLEWGGGLFVCPLEERLTEYYRDDGRLITLRQLHLPNSTDRNRIENNIEDFVDMLLRSGLGTNDVLPFDEVLQAAKKQNSAKNLSGTVVDNLEQLFCSKTVAVCYKSAGLIAASRDASMFLPMHFAADRDAFCDLQRGASLGPEIDISFEPKRIRRFSVALLDLANPIHRDPMYLKKKIAAEVLQAAALRWLARKELRKRRSAGSFFQIKCGMPGISQSRIPHHTQKEKSEVLRRMSIFDKDHRRPPLTTTSYAGDNWPTTHTPDGDLLPKS